MNAGQPMANAIETIDISIAKKCQWWMLEGELVTDAVALVGNNSRISMEVWLVEFWVFGFVNGVSGASDQVMVLCGCARGNSERKSFSKLLSSIFYRWSVSLPFLLSFKYFGSFHSTNKFHCLADGIESKWGMSFIHQFWCGAIWQGMWAQSGRIRKWEKK